MSGARVGSGAGASSACRTSGGSTPSMSSSTPARGGSARRGAIASESVAAADTALVCRLMAPRRMLGLAAIGSAAGLFSGLFGVGGGAIIVPMLVLRFGFADRRAMGTSLVAIALMAGAAMVAQGAYGNLHVDDGLLVSVPAVGGVSAGTWLQQRIPVRTVRLLFAVVLVVAAIDLALK